MSDEVPTVLNICAFKLAYHLFRSVDCRKRTVFLAPNPQRTIRLASHVMQGDECAREFQHFQMEILPLLVCRGKLSLRALVQARDTPDARPRCVAEVGGGASKRVESPRSTLC